MLPFMQDGDNKILNAKPGGDGVSSGKFEKGQTGEDQDYLVPAEHGKSAKRSTIILAVLFTIGALCLWFMIKKVAPSSIEAAVSAEETQIENAIAQLTGIRSEMHTKIDDIVNQFDRFSDVEQVDVGELKKNPFRLELSTVDSGDSGQVDIGREILREKVLRKAEDLQLLSIMQSGKGSCCIIDEKLLYEGNSIKGFTVNKIAGRSVELVCEGVKVILKMTE